MFLTGVFVSTVLIVVFLILWKRLVKYNALSNLQGPTSLELIRFMSSASHTDIYKYLLELPKKYGPVVRLWVKPFRPAVLVTDPKFFEQILMKKEYVHKTDAYKLFIPIVGNGLATNLDVDAWRKDRKLLGPCFNQKAISQYPLVYQEHIAKLVNTIKTKDSEPLDVQSLLQRYTLGVTFELLTRENISTNEDAVKTYLSSMKAFLSVYLERLFSSIKYNDFLFSFYKSSGTYFASGKNVHDYIEDIIKKQMTIRNNNNSDQAKDFLGILLDRRLEYESLISHMKTFIVAGSDTTAHGVSFALYELAKKPKIQQKIYEEYTTIIGTENDYTACYEDIQKLKYTETVAKEVMRLYPSVPIIQRKLTTPVSIDGTVIPSDTDVFFSIIGLHTSPTVYDKPKEFDPDRFAPENSSKIQAGSYAPFSLGPRDCIGQRIAMNQMKFTISYLIRHFELHPVVPEYKLDIVGDMAMTSLNGIPVIFKERK